MSIITLLNFIITFDSVIDIFRYENLTMRYAEIVCGCENLNFHLKMFDIFKNFVQNIDCEYTLEPPRRDGSKSTNNLCFGSKIKKIGIPLQTPFSSL